MPTIKDATTLAALAYGTQVLGVNGRLGTKTGESPLQPWLIGKSRYSSREALFYLGGAATHHPTPPKKGRPPVTTPPIVINDAESLRRLPVGARIVPVGSLSPKRAVKTANYGRPWVITTSPNIPTTFPTFSTSHEVLAELGGEVAVVAEPRGDRYRRVVTSKHGTMRGQAVPDDRNSSTRLAFLPDGVSDPILLDTTIWDVAFEAAGFVAPQAPVGETGHYTYTHWAMGGDILRTSDASTREESLSRQVRLAQQQRDEALDARDNARKEAKDLRSRLDNAVRSRDIARQQRDIAEEQRDAARTRAAIAKTPIYTPDPGAAEMEIVALRDKLATAEARATHFKTSYDLLRRKVTEEYRTPARTPAYSEYERLVGERNEALKDNDRLRDELAASEVRATLYRTSYDRNDRLQERVKHLRKVIKQERARVDVARTTAAALRASVDGMRRERDAANEAAHGALRQRDEARTTIGVLRDRHRSALDSLRAQQQRDLARSLARAVRDAAWHTAIDESDRFTALTKAADILAEIQRETGVDKA